MGRPPRKGYSVYLVKIHRGETQAFHQTRFSLFTIATVHAPIQPSKRVCILGEHSYALFFVGHDHRKDRMCSWIKVNPRQAPIDLGKHIQGYAGAHDLGMHALNGYLSPSKWSVRGGGAHARVSPSPTRGGVAKRHPN